MFQYPERKNEQFELIGDTMFEINFELNNKKCKTFFLKTGTWLGEEMEINTDQLPVKISDYIKTKYSGFNIIIAVKATSANYITVYKIIIDDRTKKIELKFSQEGGFLE